MNVGGIQSRNFNVEAFGPQETIAIEANKDRRQDNGLHSLSELVEDMLLDISFCFLF